VEGVFPPTRLVQTDLAESRRAIARGGADGFYGGGVAAAIEDDMRANGGLITRQDLAGYPRVEGRLLRASYRGLELLTPPLCGGIAVLETLRILERHETPQSLHVFAEAARLALADRFRHVGDSAAFDHLLSDEHATKLAA